MKLVFGKKDCERCRAVKEGFKKVGAKYKFMDLDTPEGLTEAAIRGLIPQCEKSLPVVIEETNKK